MKILDLLFKVFFITFATYCSTSKQIIKTTNLLEISKNQKVEHKTVGQLEKGYLQKSIKSNDEMNLQTLVIENGSGSIVAGFSGKDEPDAIFPSIVGKPTKKAIMIGMNAKNIYVGNIAASKVGLLKLYYPIEKGFFTNWDEMKAIWHYTFSDELKASPTEHPVLLTETPLNSESDREEMTKIMFEEFGVPSLYVANKAVLSLYATGGTTGVVLHSEDRVTYIVPINEGKPINDAIIKMDFGLRDLKNYMMKLLTSRNSLSDTYDEIVLTDIFENYCYVALDYDQEIKKVFTTLDLQIDYELPNGKLITIDEERLKVPEAFFKPYYLGMEIDGIHINVYNSIIKCAEGLRKSLFENIVLSGENTIIRGFSERLQKELHLLAPSSMNVKIVAHPQRRILPWIGGSKLASLNTFKDMLITREEYEKYGPTITKEKL